MCQKRPSVCQKRPSVCQKRPSVCQKRPIVCQKRPSVCQKRPSVTWEPTLPLIRGVRSSTVRPCMSSPSTESSVSPTEIRVLCAAAPVGCNSTTLNIPLEFGFRSAPMPTSPSLPLSRQNKCQKRPTLRQKRHTVCGLFRACLAAPPPSSPVEGLRCRRFTLASTCPAFPLSACPPAPLAAPSPARISAYPPPRPPSRREAPPSRPTSRSLSLSLRRSRSSTLMEGTPAKDCAEALDVRPSDADSKAFSLRWSRARWRLFCWVVVS